MDVRAKRPASCFIALTAIALVLGVTVAATQELNRGFWITNGPATCLFRDGNRLIVGGNFSAVGPATGGGAALNTTTGALAHSFPRIDGIVSAAVPDGAGGWFVAGAGLRVEGPDRPVIHVLSDGTLSSWIPQFDVGGADCLALQGRTLYLGASFGGTARLAAVDAVSGAARPWSPNVHGQVFQILVRDSLVYLCGWFDTVGGLARSNLAAVDTALGAVSSWNPSPNGMVRSMAFLGDTLFLGGSFGIAGGQYRPYLAAVSAVDGSAFPWQPNPNGSVRSIAARAGTVYAAGGFSYAGGQDRNYLVAVDASTGAAKNWDAGFASGLFFPVTAIAVTDQALYVGGSFSGIGGFARSNAAAFDLVTGAPTSWNPNAGNSLSHWVTTVSPADSEVFVGGSFTTVGGVSRSGVAAIDIDTGQATSWAPNVSGLVNALAVRGGVVYLGGTFSSVGGQARANLAAVDAASGVVMPWNPNADSWVYSLASGDSVIYAGGEFTSVGGQSRAAIAALDPVTGSASSWNPHATLAASPAYPPSVWSILVASGLVYPGGSFTGIGGSVRRGIAALDPGSGAATPWNPAPNEAVYALAIADTLIYAAGYFTQVGGQEREHLAAVGIASGTVMNWNPAVDEQVYSLALGHGQVYAGGLLQRVGSAYRKFLAAIDPATGLAASWTPDPWSTGTRNSAAVMALLASGPRLFAAGGFDHISETCQSYLAAYSMAPLAVEPGASASVGRTLSVFPTPARSRARIGFVLDADSRVTLSIHDVQGRRVASILDHVPVAGGAHDVHVETAHWAAGVYLIRMEIGSRATVGKLVVMK